MDVHLMLDCPVILRVLNHATDTKVQPLHKCCTDCATQTALKN